MIHLLHTLTNVDELVEITKDVFINLYNEDNYFNNISGRLANGAELEQPHIGKLNIKEIEDSDYFFA